MCADARSRDHQGMADVVAVSDVGEFQTAHGTKFFLDGEKIAERLAGMIHVRKRVDDRHRRMRGENFKTILRKNTRDNSVHPPREAPPHIGNRFAITEMRVRVVEVNRRAAHAGDANFKCDARAQGRFLKNHRQKTAGQGGFVAIRMRFDVRGQAKQFLNMRGTPLRAGQQIGRNTQRLALGLDLGIHVYLAAASARDAAGAEGTAADLAGRSVLERTDSIFERPSFTCCAVKMNGGRKRRMWSCVQLMSRPSLSALETYGAPSTSRSTPIMRPSPRTSRMKSNFAAILFRPAFSSVPRARTLASRCFRSTVSRNVSPVAHVSGPPPNVEPWRPGENEAANSSRARNAPSGSPPARGLATMTMSGRPSRRWYANSLPVRPRPHCISSAMSAAPWPVASSRARFQNSLLMGEIPPSPWTGSMMMAQTSPLNLASRSATSFSRTKSTPGT